MDENGVKLIGFEICGEKFAFDMGYLVEIVKIQLSDITPVSSAIPILRGKWDYRGKLLSILDLRDFFDLETAPHTFESVHTISHTEQSQEAVAPQKHRPEVASKSILVINIQKRIFGFLADAVLQVFPLVTFYEYPGMISTLPGRYFAGVTIINTELVLLLAIEEFIKDYEFDPLFSEPGDNGNAGH